MSKYNHIHSIPIDSLSKDELIMAMKEWSEGDDAMEKLLWAFYHRGIHTSGCHAGARPYVGFDYEGKNCEAFISVMNTVILAPGSQVMIRPDGGNPFSGRDWYKPDITIGFDTEYKDEADLLFEEVTKVLNKEKTAPDVIDFSSIFQLLDFLLGKFSKFLIRIKHKESGEIVFSLEKSIKQDDKNFEELNTVMTNAGFQLNLPPEGNYKYWEIHIKDWEEWKSKIPFAIQSVMEHYNIPVPKSIEEVSSFSDKAYFMRKKFLEETGSLDSFNQWLEEEKKKMR